MQCNPKKPFLRDIRKNKNMSMTDEEIRKLYQYWNEHPEKFIEKVMGVKLKWYQKWWVKFLTSLKEKKNETI